MKNKKQVPQLHIYSGELPHDETAIVGNTVALTLLRNAINQVLANPTITAKTHNFTTDGEGYVANVRVLTDKELTTIPLPYARPNATNTQHWLNLHNLLEPTTGALPRPRHHPKPPPPQRPKPDNDKE